MCLCDRWLATGWDQLAALSKSLAGSHHLLPTMIRAGQLVAGTSWVLFLAGCCLLASA